MKLSSVPNWKCLPEGRSHPSALVRRAQPASAVIRISSSRLPRFAAGDAAGENLAGAWPPSLNTWDPPSAPKRRLIHLATEQTLAPRLLEPKRGRANLPHRSWAADVCAGRPTGRQRGVGAGWDGVGEPGAACGFAVPASGRDRLLGPGRKSF